MPEQLYAGPVTRDGGRSHPLWTVEFHRLYAIRLVSQLSDGLFQVGLAAFVIFSPERQTTAPAIAAAFATVLLPFTVVAPFAGVYLDRWPRHRILLWSNAIRAVLVLALAAVVFVGTGTAPVLALALLALGVNRFFLAALSAALPHTVAPRHLISANALSTTSGTMASVLGAAIGVGIRALTGSDHRGVSVVIGVAAAMYLCSAAVASRVPAGSLGPDGPAPVVPLRAELSAVVGGIAAGAAHLWHRRAAAHALAAITVHRFCYGISTVATLLLYRNYFSTGGDGLTGAAAVVVLSGAGFVLGAVLTPRAARRIGYPQWIVVLLVGAALVQLAFGLPYSSPLLMAGSFLLGIVAQGVKVTVDTTVQRDIDDAFRGRVFSFYDIIFNVSFVCAAVAAALTLPATGKSYPMLVAVAAGYLITAVVFAGRSRAHRKSTVDDPAPAGP